MALMVTFPRYTAIAEDYAHLRVEPLTKKGHSVIHAGSLKHLVPLAASVLAIQRAAKATFPAASVYGGLSYSALRLVTCGGPFDSATGHYLDNIIVYAHLVTAIHS